MENTQYTIPYLVHEFGAALSEEMEGVQWTGKGGVFDGFGHMTGATLVTMAPLGMASASGGLARDARAKAFRAASTTQLQAFGGTEEAIAAINAADGLDSLDTAIEHFMATRDPNSDTARAAVQQLNAQHEAQPQAVRDLENSGILPRAVKQSDGGFTLYDTTTGEEIATAPDWESATRVATTHANMVEERDSDRIAAVASAYQAAQFSGDWSKLTGQQTETHLDFGTNEDTKQAAARSEDHRQRVESQELLDGGDGLVTRAVLGESRTTFEQSQARTVNRILDGGSILTIFHEEAHGFRRRAHQNRSLTVADDIAVLRAVDTVLAGKATREG
ncbi:MAG: hypothetical protein EOP88_26545, partial [Verrucomicrobiaceae bacterium]